MLNIPFFYFLFSKPSDAMIAALSKIRQRVHLPALARELGKYYCHVFFPLILSLMYTAKSLALVNGAYGLLDIIRNQPYGFERMAPELNTEELIAKRQVVYALKFTSI